MGDGRKEGEFADEGKSLRGFYNINLSLPYALNGDKALKR